MHKYNIPCESGMSREENLSGREYERTRGKTGDGGEVGRSDGHSAGGPRKRSALPPPPLPPSPPLPPPPFLFFSLFFFFFFFFFSFFFSFSFLSLLNPRNARPPDV